MSCSSSNDRANCWRTMAVIEVDASCDNLDDVLEDLSFDSRLEAMPTPNREVRHFALVVNASRGPDRSAMAAYALLSALQAIAEGGGLPRFRIVAGAHWLDNVVAPKFADAATPGLLAA